MTFWDEEEEKQKEWCRDEFLRIKECGGGWGQRTGNIGESALKNEEIKTHGAERTTSPGAGIT